MNFLAKGQARLNMEAGTNLIQVDVWPILAITKVSYDATDPPLPSEEDDEGNIIPSASLNLRDDLDDTGEVDEDD